MQRLIPQKATIWKQMSVQKGTYAKVTAKQFVSGRTSFGDIKMALFTKHYICSKTNASKNQSQTIRAYQRQARN